MAENGRIRKQRELDALTARDRELDMLFERLYEDNVSGKIDDARFAKMSKRYEQEQGENAKKIKALRLERKKDESKRIVSKGYQEITLSNPGSFRVPLDTAKSGGVSAPRNPAMARMFRFVDVGEYTGGGIPNLYRIWKSEGWPEPVFSESCSPDRVSLTLYMTSRSNDGENAVAGKQVPLSALSQRQLLIDYLTDHPTSDLFALSKSLGTSLSRTESLLQQLADEGIVVVEAGQGNRLYKLKA